jgi:hypothetical protein
MPRLRQPTVQEDDISFFACIGEHGCSRCELFSYKSLAELNEEWEDYKPAEPLIKDEKVRKAVRAWAEATGTTSISYWGGELESEQNDSKIEFDGIAVVDFGDNYTIAELCGEEEE